MTPGRMHVLTPTAVQFPRNSTSGWLPRLRRIPFQHRQIPQRIAHSRLSRKSCNDARERLGPRRRHAMVRPVRVSTVSYVTGAQAARSIPEGEKWLTRRLLSSATPTSLNRAGIGASMGSKNGAIYRGRRQTPIDPAGCGQQDGGRDRQRPRRAVQQCQDHPRIGHSR